MYVGFFCKSLSMSCFFRVRMNGHLDYWARKLHHQLEQGEGIPKLRGSGAGCG